MAWLRVACAAAVPAAGEVVVALRLGVVAYPLCRPRVLQGVGWVELAERGPLAPLLGPHRQAMGPDEDEEHPARAVTVAGVDGGAGR